MNLLHITSLTFQEARRKRLLWVALGLGAAFLMVYGLGMNFILQELTEEARRSNDRPAQIALAVSQASGMLLVMGLFAVNFLIVMMTALTSASTISGEISSHTIQTIATKPIRRSDIVLGKWLGFGIMIVLYVLFMFGGILAVTYAISDYTPPNILTGLGLLVLEGLIVLSLSIFGGTLFSTIANGVFVFMLYGLAFVGSWVEQIGAFLESETAIQVGIITSLIMPSESMWRIVSAEMQPTLLRRMGPFATFSQPSDAMIVYGIIYSLILVGAALYFFNRRDL